LPFNEFQVAPDGATLYLTLSEDELSARPAFDLENVTADSRSTPSEPAAPAHQNLPDAASPGFVPSDTVHESFGHESAAEQAQAAAAAEVAEEAQLAAQTQQAQQIELEAEAELAQEPQQPQPAQSDAYRAVSRTKASNQPASALIGKDVVDTQNVAVGKVNDVVVTAEPPQVQVIVQLSEELGSGSKLVALPLPDLTISQGGAEDTREIDRVETELTVAQLEALPQFKY